ncbi:MAG TPA: biotin--[acetyl-CoA-carboxylase] ligase [Desulfobulbus sp.]|nr:biotin--[acetyl-CoA-carboxylase] ligase [Desulfobulbus sp.]
MNILAFDTLDSTNTRALAMAGAGADPETVIWAHRQTAGRGQQGREFASPPGGLYFSLLLQPELVPEQLSLVTLAAGVGCCRLIERSCDLDVDLKWPNDLYCRHRKLGGILTETTPVTGKGSVMVVIGVGINVNTPVDEFPEEVQPLVTSIGALTGKLYDLRALLHCIVEEIIQQVQTLQRNPDKLLALWKEHDYCKGQTITWETGHRCITGIGRGLLDDGRYSLEDQSGSMHAILAGRIQPVFCATKEDK